jgi:hypothetical protein
MALTKVTGGLISTTTSLQITSVNISGILTASTIAIGSTLTGPGGVGYATEGYVSNSLVGYATEGYVTTTLNAAKTLTVGTRAGAASQNVVGTGITISLRTGGIGTASF